MPLGQLSATASLTFDLSAANVFGSVDTGPVTESFNWPAGLSLTQWTQAFAQQYVLAASAFIEFDLTTFTNLVNEAVVGEGHVLGIFILPTNASTAGAICNLAPGSTNGLQWFFGGPADSININPGGVFFLSEDPAGAGQALSGTSKTLRITNTGTQSLTVVVLAPVGP